MENHVTLVVVCTVIFNATLVCGIMWVVRKVKMDQRKRQDRMVEQAKLNTELREINAQKDKLLDSYRDLIGKM
jgi:hypothetical protein